MRRLALVDIDRAAEVRLLLMPVETQARDQVPEPFPVAGKGFDAETARLDAVLDAFGRSAELQAPPLLLVVDRDAVALHQIAVVVGGGVIGVGRPVRVEGIPVGFVEGAYESGIERQAPFLAQRLGIAQARADVVGRTEAVVMQVQFLFGHATARQGPFATRTAGTSVVIVEVGMDRTAVIPADALVAATAADAEMPLGQIGALGTVGTVEEGGCAGEGLLLLAGRRTGAFIEMRVLPGELAVQGELEFALFLFRFHVPADRIAPLAPFVDRFGEQVPVFPEGRAQGLGRGVGVAELVGAAGRDLEILDAGGVVVGTELRLLRQAAERRHLVGGRSAHTEIESLSHVIDIQRIADQRKLVLGIVSRDEGIGVVEQAAVVA